MPRLVAGIAVAGALVAVSVVAVMAPLVTAWRLAGTLGTHQAMHGDDRIARSMHFGPARYDTAGFSAPVLKDPERLAGLAEPPPAIEAPSIAATAEPAPVPGPALVATVSVHPPKPAAPVKAAPARLAALPVPAVKPTPKPAATPAVRDTWSVKSLFDSVTRRDSDSAERDDAVGSISAYAPADRPLGDDHKTAVYDITGHTVYMPNGARLEAHSGLGPYFDNPAGYKLRMRGPTPPNVYRLTMRERLFHGVAAIRLNPLDHAAMNGRDGMLAHTYMLGPRGESNGCVSFRDYSKFLAAFRRGEVTHMIVVAKMTGTPAQVIAAHRGFAGKYAAGRGSLSR